MVLPRPRGPVSDDLVGALSRSPHDLPPALADKLAAADGGPDPM